MIQNHTHKKNGLPISGNAAELAATPQSWRFLRISDNLSIVVSIMGYENDIGSVGR